MALAERQQQLIDDLLLIENPQERLSAVVDRVRRAPPLPSALRDDAHRVPGCVSQVWLVSELRDSRCHFRCDAEGPLVRGLVALLCEFFTDVPPAEIAVSTCDPLAALGLLENLSPTRQNGLAAVRAAIRTFARAHLSA
ncbi:MAG: SufE family protein [Opitutaceae bacterium]|nr:SufE family protein [Opitutaceae bacterium]